MNVGMLWLDRDAKSVSSMVQAAAAHYRTKYGAEPTICFVNPGALAQLETMELQVDGIKVLGKTWILPLHLMIGQEGGSGKQS